MPYVMTGSNVQLYCKDWGTGRPVVMMHGWPLSSDTFDDLGMAIAKAGMRAIAYDRRGFGRSQQPWDGYDYDTLADDLAAMLEYARAKDAVILGFSMGGGEVARYMSRHGGRSVSRAILVASVVPYMLKTADNPNGVDQGVFDGMAKQIAQDRAKFWTGFFKDFYGVSTLSQPVSDEVLEWSRDVSMQASLKASPRLRGVVCHHRLPSRPPPPSRFQTLIIHGTSDRTVPDRYVSPRRRGRDRRQPADRVRRRPPRAFRVPQRAVDSGRSRIHPRLTDIFAPGVRPSSSTASPLP
jgi:pimeloyl-ACP methyl ester carboxylesterase